MVYPHCWSWEQERERTESPDPASTHTGGDWPPRLSGLAWTWRGQRVRIEVHGTDGTGGCPLQSVVKSSGIHTLNILRILCKSQKNIFAQGMNFQDISYSKHTDKHFFSIHMYFVQSVLLGGGYHIQYSTCIPFIKVLMYIFFCCTSKFSMNTNIANE